MAARLVRSIVAICSSSASFSSAAPKCPQLPWFSRSTSSAESFRVVVPGATLLHDLQCRVNQSSSLISSSFRSRFTEDKLLSKGVDFKHWQVAISRSHLQGSTKERVIDDYVEILTKVLGSEEEARKKIYSISFDGYCGFGSEVDEETAEKLQDVPGVLFVLPDNYVDNEAKDYGGEPVVNGKLVDSPRKVGNEDGHVKMQMLKLMHQAYTIARG